MQLKHWGFWKRGKLVHDADKCDCCGLCAERCPHRSLKMNKETGEWKLKGICMRCGRCIRECPQGALHLEK